MLDILLIGSATFGAGALAGMLFNVGRVPLELADVDALAEANSKLAAANVRIEAQKAAIKHLTPLAELGEKLRKARDTQNAKRKAARHARGLKRQPKA